MKKRLICLFLAVLLLTPSVFAAGNDQYTTARLFVDGRELVTDVSPIVENGRTLVPVRAIFEALSAVVEWDGATSTATATKEGITVSLTIGSTTAYVNGEPKTLDVPAKIVNDRTLVPARFVAESLNAIVWWETETDTAYIATTINYDGYRLLPNDIFTSTDATNKFADTYMYVDGCFTGYDITDDGIPLYSVSTPYGELILVDVDSEIDPDSLYEDTIYRICFLYVESDAFEGLIVPFVAFCEFGDLSVTPHNPGQATAPVTPSTPDPQPSAPSTPSTPPTPSTPSIPSTGQHSVVYVTKTGKHYHYSSTCNGGTYYASTIDQAIARGLTPCSKCCK